MQKFAIIFVLCLFVPDAYLYLRFISRRHTGLWARTLFWLPTVVMVGMFVWLMYASGSNPLHHHAVLMENLSRAILIVGAPKLVLMVCSLLGDLFSRLSRHLRRPFIVLGVVASLLTLGTAVYGSFVGIRRITVRRIDVSDGQLPAAFNGYRIVQLSDLHIGSFRNKLHDVERLVERVNSLHPDLIVFTGDLVNLQADELKGTAATLSQLRATDGVLSVLGNHDYGDYYRWKSVQEKQANLDSLVGRQQQMGWALLRNTHRIVRRGTDSIAVVGVENAGLPPFPDFSDLSAARQGTDSLFQVLLTHDPTLWDRQVVGATDINLSLAGHTHGGQFMLQGWSPVASRYPQWHGMHSKGRQHLYVSVGTGYLGLPFRLGAWPEVVLITLHQGQ